MADDAKRKVNSFNRFKQYQSKRYTGMPVGRSHKWNYDQGEWRERKLSPDEWEIFYQTIKRRAFHAPEESGAPVGTEYNWLIVCHQRVDKLDANSYMTWMEGKKFKVAHKRAAAEAWNAGERAQRKKVIQYLKQMIAELEQADASADLPYSVGEHDHIYGLNLRTKDELHAIARDYGVPVKSSMKRAELLHAVQKHLHETVKSAKAGKRDRGETAGAEARPRAKTKIESKHSATTTGV